MSREIEALVRNLVRHLTRDHQLPNGPLSVTLRIDGNTAGVPVTPREVGSGTIIFDAPLPLIPSWPCVLSICVGQTARVDFPVRISAEGLYFRASMDGAALVLRRRPTRNVRLEEALGVAA